MSCWCHRSRHLITTNNNECGKKRGFCGGEFVGKSDASASRESKGRIRHTMRLNSEFIVNLKKKIELSDDSEKTEKPNAFCASVWKTKGLFLRTQAKRCVQWRRLSGIKIVCLVGVGIRWICTDDTIAWANVDSNSTSPNWISVSRFVYLCTWSVRVCVSGGICVFWWCHSVRAQLPCIGQSNWSA